MYFAEVVTSDGKTTYRIIYAESMDRAFEIARSKWRFVVDIFC